MCAWQKRDCWYHFSNCSNLTVSFALGPAAASASSAASMLSSVENLEISEITSESSVCEGLCPRSFKSSAISVASRMLSPLLSSLSKTLRTSIAIRVSLVVYHFLKSSKASLSSFLSGICFQILEAASAWGGTQPSFCMKRLNSRSLISPSSSLSISLKASKREPLSSVITAMPAVSLRDACCVRSLMTPLRNLEGMRMLTIEGLLLPTSTGVPAGFSSSGPGSGLTAIGDLWNLLSNHSFARSFTSMKQQYATYQKKRSIASHHSILAGVEFLKNITMSPRPTM
mmetsp:Transcript_25585/g.73908  ORF Transcript_25585/g.73908 Transcript_25585/m.73908 type:complete len:285 (+) Transcript_25585:775-1629(+)